MPPFVIAARPEDLDRGPGAAIAGVGRRVTEVATELHRLKIADQTAKRRDQLDNRRLDIAELNAKRLLLAESNRNAALTQRGQAAAAKAASVEQESMHTGEQLKAEAAGANTFEALAKGGGAGGALGPFGMFNPKALAQGAAQTAATATRMNQKVELAKRMTPEAARGYLQRAANQERVGLYAEHYQREQEAIGKGVADGWLPPEEAEQFAQLLQTAAAAGQPPGETQRKLAKRYDLHVKLKRRSDEWAKADAKAEELLAIMEQLVQRADEGVDPETGESLRVSMNERLAQAQTEWERTRLSPTFRMETDPQASLAGLQKVIFGAQAIADPLALRREVRTEQRPGVQASPPLRSGGTTATTPPPGWSVRQPEPGAAQEAGEAKAKDTPQQAQLRRTVRSMAAEIDRSDMTGSLERLLKGIARDMGVDQLPPEVFAVVQDELSRIVRGESKVDEGKAKSTGKKKLPALF